MSEKAVSDDLEALNLKIFLARRQPWWRLVSLGHTPKGMTNIFSLATPLIDMQANFSSTEYNMPGSVRNRKGIGHQNQYVFTYHNYYWIDMQANLSSTEYNMPGSVRNTKGFTTRQKCVCIREASVLETVRVVRRDIFFGEILCLHMFQSCLY